MGRTGPKHPMNLAEGRVHVRYLFECVRCDHKVEAAPALLMSSARDAMSMANPCEQRA